MSEEKSKTEDNTEDSKVATKPNDRNLNLQAAIREREARLVKKTKDEEDIDEADLLETPVKMWRVRAGFRVFAGGGKKNAFEAGAYLPEPPKGELQKVEEVTIKSRLQLQRIRLMSSSTRNIKKPEDFNVAVRNIQQREIELSDFERALFRRKEELELRASKLKSREEKLSAREAEVEQSILELDAREADLTEAELKLSAREAELKDGDETPEE